MTSFFSRSTRLLVTADAKHPDCSPCSSSIHLIQFSVIDSSWTLDLILFCSWSEGSIFSCKVTSADWIMPSIFLVYNAHGLSEFGGLNMIQIYHLELTFCPVGINEVDSAGAYPPSLLDASNDNGNAQQWMNTMYDCLTILVCEDSDKYFMNIEW